MSTTARDSGLAVSAMGVEDEDKDLFEYSCIRACFRYDPDRKDYHTCYESPCCMLYRESTVARITTGAIIGLIAGLIASETMPIAPPKYSCTGAVGAFNQFEGACYNYYYSADYFQFLEKPKKTGFCIGNNGIIEYPIPDGGCTSTASADLEYAASDDKLICYGNVSDTMYVSVDDDSDCSKFKDMWDVDASVLYLDDAATMPSAEATGTQCYDSTQNKFITEACTGADKVELTQFSLDPETSWEKHLEYKHAKFNFDQVVVWLFTWPGKIWYNGLKMVVFPLVVANMITSVAKLKTLPGSRKLACYTVLYYVVTTICAAISGLIWVSIILIPFLEEIEVTEEEVAGFSGPSKHIPDTLTQIKLVINTLVEPNIVGAFQNNNYLGVICFSIIMGAVVPIKNNKPDDSVFFNWFNELNHMMMILVQILIVLAPLGVFCYVAGPISTHPLGDLLSKISMFLITVFIALAFHNFVTYPIIFFTITKQNPFAYMRNIIPAMVTALGVSSSIATLPVTMRCAISSNQIRPHVAKFVLSLGATINMDGTSIGFPCAVIFVAKAQGIPVNFGQMIVIVMLSTIQSMGAAPIPQAGLVLLVLILENLGIPTGSVFGLIIAVDWLYDRPETMTNIVGDSFAAGIMNHLFGSKHGTILKSQEEGTTAGGDEDDSDSDNAN